MRVRLRKLKTALLTAAAVSLAATSALAQSNPLRDAFFGETHLHTSWSFDAYIFGNHLTGPADAYKYAKGETIKHPLGYDIKIDTPLTPPSVLQSELQPLGYARSASIGSARNGGWREDGQIGVGAFVCGRKPWGRARRLGRFKPPRARSFYVVRPRAARPRHAGLVDLTLFR